MTINLTVEDVFLGDTTNNTHFNVCNFIIWEAKWQIWKHRNNVKFGNKNRLKIQMNCVK